MEVNDIQENYNTGWIKIYRSIRKHWLFPKNKPLTKFEAWILILLEVNHDDEKFQVGYDIFECKRGEKYYSLETWSKLFHWDKSRTRRYFELLQKDEMICIKSVQKTTHLTVCNYDSYQGGRNGNETQVKRKRNESETQVKPIKEYKNDKNILFSKFYDEELELAKKIVEGKPEVAFYQNEYKKFIADIYDFRNREKKDELGRSLCKPKKNLLALPDQMSFREFGEVYDTAKKYNVDLYEILGKMNNHKSMKKNTNFYRTTLTWLKPKNYD